MFEDSTDAFVSRWRRHAADVRIFSRVEGSPLVECEVAGSILQMLERTGPYLVRPGAGRAIINITCDGVEPKPGGQLVLESTGVGKARGCGEVFMSEPPFLLVDAGAPLLLGVERFPGDEVAVGTVVSFESVGPMHFFALTDLRAPVSSSADSEAP